MFKLIRETDLFIFSKDQRLSMGMKHLNGFITDIHFPHQHPFFHLILHFLPSILLCHWSNFTTFISSLLTCKAYVQIQIKFTMHLNKNRSLKHQLNQDCHQMSYSYTLNFNACILFSFSSVY